MYKMENESLICGVFRGSIKASIQKSTDVVHYISRKKMDMGSYSMDALMSPWILLYTHLNCDNLTGVLVYARNTNTQETDKIQQISWAVGHSPVSEKSSIRNSISDFTKEVITVTHMVLECLVQALQKTDASYTIIFSSAYEYFRYLCKRN